MDEISISFSYLLKQSDIRTFYLKNIARMQALWLAGPDDFRVMDAFYLTRFQKERAEGL